MTLPSLIAIDDKYGLQAQSALEHVSGVLNAVSNTFDNGDSAMPLKYIERTVGALECLVSDALQYLEEYRKKVTEVEG